MSDELITDTDDERADDPGPAPGESHKERVDRELIELPGMVVIVPEQHPAPLRFRTSRRGLHAPGEARPRRTTEGRYDAGAMSEFLPQPSGFLEWFFLLTLIGLTVTVGAFAGFLILNVFRNPGRKPRA